MKRYGRTLLSLLAAASFSIVAYAQQSSNGFRETLKARFDSQAVTFEFRGPDHQLTQDIPFKVTVLADADPDLMAKLRQHFEDGIPAPGFTELGLWPNAIQFTLDDGVRMIGQTKFGVYWSPAHTAFAWEATMVVSVPGERVIKARPTFKQNNQPMNIKVSAESHWPAGLQRAILLSLLVIVAAVLLVTPARVLPLFLISVIAGVMAYLAVPAGFDDWRWFAAIVPVLGAVIAGFSRRTLLELLLPERQSGHVRREVQRGLTQDQETPRRSWLRVLFMQPIRDPGNRTQAKPPDVAPAPPILIAPEAPVPPPAAAQTTDAPDASAATPAVPAVAAIAPVVTQAPAIVPTVATIKPAAARSGDGGALERYKTVADGIVAATEHRAQWQLVLGGATGVAAVVFLLRATVTFGDAAIIAPPTDGSLMPLLVRVLPYLLCFTALLLAAGFLLRQYRASLDDFRHFIRNQRLRESQVVAVTAALSLTNPDEAVTKTIQILAWGEASAGGDRESSGRNAAADKEKPEA